MTTGSTAVSHYPTTFAMLRSINGISDRAASTGRVTLNFELIGPEKPPRRMEHNCTRTFKSTTSGDQRVLPLLRIIQQTIEQVERRATRANFHAEMMLASATITSLGGKGPTSSITTSMHDHIRYETPEDERFKRVCETIHHLVTSKIKKFVPIQALVVSAEVEIGDLEDGGKKKELLPNTTFITEDSSFAKEDIARIIAYSVFAYTLFNEVYKSDWSAVAPEFILRVKASGHQSQEDALHSKRPAFELTIESAHYRKSEFERKDAGDLHMRGAGIDPSDTEHDFSFYRDTDYLGKSTGEGLDSATKHDRPLNKELDYTEEGSGEGDGEGWGSETDVHHYEPPQPPPPPGPPPSALPMMPWSGHPIPGSLPMAPESWWSPSDTPPGSLPMAPESWRSPPAAPEGALSSIEEVGESESECPTDDISESRVKTTFDASSRPFVPSFLKKESKPSE